MILPILQDKKFGTPALAALIQLKGQQIHVLSKTKVLLKLIEVILPYPTKIKERDGEVVTKRWPKSASENLVATLKQNLYYPYRIAESKSVEVNPEGFKAKYKKIYPTNVLYGELRHESTREALRASA